tara:strand:+ start:1795 stop:2820 length:1026 start_codon:yes stop_codon:yes gene_type:complete
MKGKILNKLSSLKDTTNIANLPYSNESKTFNMVFIIICIVLIISLGALFYFKRDFFRNLVCYPYSFPVGILNSLSGNRIGFCYESESKSNKLKPGDDKIDHEFGSGILTKNQVRDINRLISKRVNNVHNIEIAKQYANQVADINVKKDYKWLGRVVKNNPQWGRTDKDGFPNVLFCQPKIDQTITQTIDRSTSISDKDQNEIINKIAGNVSTTQREMGNKDSPHEGEIIGSNENRNLLLSNIKNQITNISNMVSQNSSSINYKDNWGICNKDGEANTIRQTTDVNFLSNNIIKTTTELMMKNNTKIKSSINVTINRVSYRVAFTAFLLNFVCIYIFLSIIF